MAFKLIKGQYPDGHGPNDFECFGPIATEDGQFDSCKLADLGCFKQDGTDSNKYYHGAVARSKKTSGWFAFFQWGRTGGRGDVQFVECHSESDAQEAFAKQMHSKNDKRGEWTVKPGLGKILQAKAGKDCYLVRAMATRGQDSPGLPDARRVTSDDGAKKPLKTAKKKSGKKKTVDYDQQTVSLMKDLNVATVKFAKGAIQGGTLPTQSNIDKSRDALIAAQKRVLAVGNDVDDQINDKDLRELSYLLYSWVPKIKRVGAPESEWILSQTNIGDWQQDLDAFESALYATNLQTEQVDDPFGGMKITMRWLSPSSDHGEFVRKWMPKATKNRHSWCDAMSIKNVWEFEQHGVAKTFDGAIDRITKGKVNCKERPILQPRKRTDLSATNAARYESANVGMMFHGTRSVNVSGILREGLRLPRQLVGVVITGAMFGPGIYWADDWKKSAGYTSLSGSYWSSGDGGVRGRKAFMFVADVALGTAHVARGPRGYTSPPTGCHCVFGKANVSQVQNNEWIVYQQDQNHLRYLVEFNA